jgi:hypothetical protein
MLQIPVATQNKTNRQKTNNNWNGKQHFSVLIFSFQYQNPLHSRTYGSPLCVVLVSIIGQWMVLQIIVLY